MLALVDRPTPAAAGNKPLLKTTMAGMIRKAQDADLDDDLEVPNPKRARVTFNPKVEEKVLEEYVAKGRSVESIRVEVKQAIEAHGKGDSEKYDSIKGVFEQTEGDEREGTGANDDVKTYLIALTSYASLLNKDCNGLVKAILKCEWMGREEGFVKAYAQFLGNLVSAQGAYVGLVLGTLIDHFTGSMLPLIGVSSPANENVVRVSSGRLPGCPYINRDTLSSRVHFALKYLLRLIPSASATLSPILSAKFPFADETKRVHVTYINNLVRLLQYAPELKSDVFALITDRLVKIDVQMQVDLEDVDDEVAGAIVQALAMNPSEPEEEDEDNAEDSDDSDAESVNSNDADGDQAKRAKEIQGSVEKMDAILDRLFAIYDPYFTDPNSIEAANMFETLLGHFANIILPTYRSRHTQFLLFHFAQKSEHLIDQFAGTCVQLAFQPGRPAVLRQSSAAYLASFVARGAHVEPQVVRTVFELIGSNLDHIRTENELTCRGPDLKKYGTFYAMTQALLYIFCFRWRDLIDSSEVFDDEDPAAFIGQDLVWTTGVKETLSRAIYSKLNPLKICSPPIVSEFAKIAHHLRFMYVYPLLETNKRIRLSQFSSAAGNGALRDSGASNDSWHQLDAYFPFDPYQLPVSKKWIEDDYVQWKGIPGLNQEEDDDDSSGDEEEEDDDENAAEDDDTATDEEAED
ncbi:DNA independent RNA polymerase I transcription factor [Ciborinia camelliae]|nr:DNA independent RNA polymerase I transcription factor [Ciborinia camelliae]